MTGSAPHIGTLREKPLHASLKKWYSQPGDQIEVPVEGFVIDLVRKDLLIEIQTRGFSSMKQKVAALLAADRRIRIAYPISLDKWIVRVDDAGTILGRRRSPRHGAPADLFTELVAFPHLATHPGLEIDLIMVNEEEYRAHTPGRSWRRKGWSVIERRLIEVVDTLLIRNADDLLALMPAEIPEPFTTAELAERLGRPRRTAQQMAYCLRHAGLITQIGKTGNTLMYEIA